MNASLHLQARLVDYARMKLAPTWKGVRTVSSVNSPIALIGGTPLYNSLEGYSLGR